MVNAKKHRELLNDYPTRLRKKIARQQLLSKNSQKNERIGNHLLFTSGGKTGKDSIVETDLKRAEANKEFKRIVKQLEA